MLTGYTVGFYSYMVAGVWRYLRNINDVKSPFFMVHAGQIIRDALREKGKTVTWFASEMCCTRTNAHKIFRKQNLDIDILWRASLVLNCDLFEKISEKLSAQNSVELS